MTPARDETSLYAQFRTMKIKQISRDAVKYVTLCNITISLGYMALMAPQLCSYFDRYMALMVPQLVMPHYLMYEQGEEGRGRGGRGGGEEEGEGRGTGVSEVDVSECPTQSLQQDLEAHPHVLPSYPLHVVSSVWCYCLLLFLGVT